MSKEACFFWGTVIGGILAMIFISIPVEPTALDAHQGKTILEITYRDSIPVDSVVVFKEEFKK